MSSIAISVEVCGAGRKAVETVEKSPPKSSVDFSTVSTASTADLLSSQKEAVSWRRKRSDKPALSPESFRVHRILGSPSIMTTFRRPRESLFLTSPFIERSWFHISTSCEIARVHENLPTEGLRKSFGQYTKRCRARATQNSVES